MRNMFKLNTIHTIYKYHTDVTYRHVESCGTCSNQIPCTEKYAENSEFETIKFNSNLEVPTKIFDLMQRFLINVCVKITAY